MRAYFQSCLVVFLLLLGLAGCQSPQKSQKMIAGVFNASTQIQEKFINWHAPRNIELIENIPYSQQPTLHLDLYRAEQSNTMHKAPTVLWVHGGGWISGSKQHAQGYFKRLAQHGVNVVAVEYQFAPQVTYPKQLEQIDQALVFLSSHATQLQLDANQLYLAGDSAGANMVSHYAALLTNPDFAQDSAFTPHIQAAQIKGLILHCGIYDLEHFVATATDEVKLLEWGILNLVQAYTGGQQDNAALLASISPAQHISANYPPVLISGGNHDFLTKNQSLPFVNRLKQQGVAVTELFYPDSKEFLVHEYQFMMSKKASQRTFEQTLMFIRHYSDAQTGP